MNSLNSVLMEGNLTKDPEMKIIPGGSSVCNMSIAVNSYYKKEGETVKETSFFDIQAWNGLGTNCAEYLKKGRGVRVVGKMKQDRWIDKDNGDKKFKVYIVAEHIDFKPAFSN